MYVASGMNKNETFYLGPDPAIGGLVEYHHNDKITDAQYAAALPETKRLIDDLVVRAVLLKVDDEQPEKGEEK